MIVLKILAVPFVVALTLLALVLFIGSQTLGGVVFLVLAFDVSNQKLNLQTGSLGFQWIPIQQILFEKVNNICGPVKKFPI